MKNSLKTFPSGATLIDMIYEKWKLDFEAELREKIKEFDQPLKSGWTRGKAYAFKEILGE